MKSRSAGHGLVFRDDDWRTERRNGGDWEINVLVRDSRNKMEWEFIKGKCQQPLIGHCPSLPVPSTKMIQNTDGDDIKRSLRLVVYLKWNCNGQMEGDVREEEEDTVEREFTSPSLLRQQLER